MRRPRRLVSRLRDWIIIFCRSRARDCSCLYSPYCQCCVPVPVPFASARWVTGAQASSSPGWAYAKGRGVRQDFAEAFRGFQLGAEFGNAQAQHYLGLAYANGRGVEQDYVQALMWINLANFGSVDDEYNTLSSDRAALEANMTPEQIVRAQRLADVWRSKSPLKPIRPDRSHFIGPHARRRKPCRSEGNRFRLMGCSSKNTARPPNAGRWSFRTRTAPNGNALRFPGACRTEHLFRQASTSGPAITARRSAGF